MKYVSATEAKQTFAAVIDKAQREPVIIRKQNIPIINPRSFWDDIIDSPPER